MLTKNAINNISELVCNQYSGIKKEECFSQIGTPDHRQDVLLPSFFIQPSSGELERVYFEE